MNLNCVAVPLTVVNFVVSYAAVPWCADARSDTKRRQANTAKMSNRQFFMRNLHSKLRTEPAGLRRLSATPANKIYITPLSHVSKVVLLACFPNGPQYTCSRQSCRRSPDPKNLSTRSAQRSQREE